MPATELSEWQRFYVDEPFGEVRADLRAGIVAKTVAQMMGGNRKVSAMDFMPIVRREHEAAVVQDSKAIAERFNAMMFSLAPGKVRVMQRKKAN